MQGDWHPLRCPSPSTSLVTCGQGTGCMEASRLGKRSKPHFSVAADPGSGLEMGPPSAEGGSPGAGCGQALLKTRSERRRTRRASRLVPWRPHMTPLPRSCAPTSGSHVRPLRPNASKCSPEAPAARLPRRPVTMGAPLGLRVSEGQTAVDWHFVLLLLVQLNATPPNLALDQRGRGTGPSHAAQTWSQPLTRGTCTWSPAIQLSAPPAPRGTCHSFQPS